MTAGRLVMILVFVALLVLLAAGCATAPTEVVLDASAHGPAVPPAPPTPPSSAPAAPAAAQPRSGPQAASRGTPRPSHPTPSAGATTYGPPPDLDWAALRACESGGDYHNRTNPTYRGAYQFDRDTWASVGGTGDPADASAAEQDRRARTLYDRRGRDPWPQCGSRL